MNKYKVYYMIPGVKGVQTELIEASSKKVARRDFYDLHLDKKWVNIKKIDYVKNDIPTWKTTLVSAVQGILIGLGIILSNIDVSLAEGIGLVFVISFYGSIGRFLGIRK